jgi:endoglucanase
MLKSCRRRLVQRRITAVVVARAVALAACALLLAVPAASAGVANAGIPGAPSANPLAGLPWGSYSGPHDEVFPAYHAARGETRRLLGLIARRPRVRWFGAWYSDRTARRVASEYIANSTGGRDDVLSQMAVFRVDPWEGQECVRLPSARQQVSYRHWIDEFAAGIGSARVALILQPDLPFAACAPHHSRLPLDLVAYAARRFTSLPHTTVYLDAGAADWPSVRKAVWLLRGGGIRYIRGFALNATHYDSTEREIRFGQQVAEALARKGITGKHFVVNTSDNGRPFTYQQYFPHSDFDNARPCRSRHDSRCVTLGIPPTTDVTNPKWPLSGGARRIAAGLLDGYLWIGRPWLVRQAAPFDLQRSLAVARSTPF